VGIGRTTVVSVVLITTIIFASSFVTAYAFDFNPLPAANVKTMPTENDFLTKTRTELLLDYDHAVFSRENGESIYLQMNVKQNLSSFSILKIARMML